MMFYCSSIMEIILFVYNIVQIYYILYMVECKLFLCILFKIKETYFSLHIRRSFSHTNPVMGGIAVKKIKKRVAALFGLFIFCFSIVLMRIYVIGQNDTLKSAAQAQSSQTIEVTRSRGMIYDCNGEPLVDTEQRYLACVAPSEESAEALIAMLGENSRQGILEKIASRMPFVTEVPSANLFCPQIQVLKGTNRYGQFQLAEHVIGYLDAGGTNGMSGIEKAYNDYLNQTGYSASVRYTVDARGNVLDADSPQILLEEEQRGAGVVLTLDRYIQMVCEQAAWNQSLGKGAIVVMESDTGKIRAMVSSPGYYNDNISGAMEQESSPLINRALCAYPVGSTFKLCVTASALENGVTPNTIFECTGSIDVDGQVFHCHEREGHSWLDLARALKVSCNPYFIHLGSLIGAEKLYKTAFDFGFSRADMLAPGITSEEGNLPKPAEIQSDADFANLCFGQGSLLATPVQIAKMVSVFANGGNLVCPSLVESLVDAQGNVMSQETMGEPARILSEETVDTIRGYMESVVSNGTGVYAKPEHMGAGGKTASAQTGVYDKNGKEIVHAWFAGFFPEENPKYTVVVLKEGGGEGSFTAAPIFKEIADNLYYYMNQDKIHEQNDGN